MFDQSRKVSSLLILRQLILLCVVINSIVSTATAQEQIEAAAEAGAEDSARALEISNELTARQQSIEDMQSDLGIYDASLLEAYADLAAFYNELENYVDAVTLYTNALQIARINTGLHSEQQLPLIQALIDNNSKLQAWPEVDDLYQLEYYINSRLYVLADPRYTDAVENYGDWKLRVLHENLLDQSYRGLTNTALDLSDFYERVIVNIETQTDVSPENLLPIIYGKSQADLSLARSVASTPYTAFEGTARRYVTQTRCQNVRNAQGQVVRQCYNVQVENPRYRQSQRDAKRFALSRHTRAIANSIEKLRSIKDHSTALTLSQRQQLEVQIAQLETEARQLFRVTRRRALF